MNRLFATTAALFFAVASARAGDELYGTVAERADDTTRPLKSAIIQWLGRPDVGALTDARGVFRLSREGIADERIVVRYAGYVPDTLSVRGVDTIAVVLETPIQLDGVVVEGRRSASEEVFSAPMRTEVISEVEIEKDACCDLSGCFNTSAAVEPNVTDFVTDKRELQILGMSGVYNQVLVDGMPMLMTGLNSGYGLNLIPGPFIKRISVVKGANSVLQGDESITGIVDVRLKDPKDIDGAFANLFISEQRETQFNLAYAGQLSESWSSMIAGHITTPSQRMDAGGDSFLDMPLTTRYSLFSKVKYEQVPGVDSGLVSTFFVKYTDEERIGGDKNFEMGRDLGQTTFYGQTVATERLEGYLHLVQLFPGAHDYTGDGHEDDEPGRSKLSLSLAGSKHRQNAYFGTTRYDGDQYTVYADLRGERGFSRAFTLRGGVDYRLERIDESIGLGVNPLEKTYGGAYVFNEWSVGTYAEAVWTLLDESLTIMPGARIDWTGGPHRREAASYPEPLPSFRTFLMYRPDELTTVRASAGIGTRPVRFWSENSVVLASGRNVSGAPLSPLSEKGVNYGAGVSRIVDIDGILTTISVDYYRTILSDQLYIDYEADATLGLLRTDRAHSHSVQVEAAADLSPEWHTKLAYSFLEAVRAENGVDRPVPLTSRHRLLGTVSFVPGETPWQFDANVHLYGPQRLPSTEQLPEEFRRPEMSDPYTLLNVQATYRWETLDLYAGAENLLGFTQKDPVIDPSHPFGRYFDTSFIWGPIRGRQVYAGIRYTLQTR